MPVRHIAVFRFADHVTDDQIDAVSAALDGLRAKIPNLRDYRFGRDLGLADGTWDYAVVADLEDAEAYQGYRTHPDHVAVVGDVVRPLVTDRASIQYEL